MTGQYKISVIIPACNAEATIHKCLEALAGQTLAPSEVIVVDDGSRDRTVEIAARSAKVVANARRKGPGGARNTGAWNSGGDILAFTDSDCIPGPNWLSNIADSFRDGSVGAVGGGYSSGSDDSFWQTFCHEELAFRRRNLSGEVNTLVSNNFACRRSVFLELGGFPEDFPLPSLEDMLFSYLISRKYKVLWVNDSGVAHHFKRGLIAYLRHQYVYALESTKFFLRWPRVLFGGNHQGRALYEAIVLAWCAFASSLAAIVSFVVGVPLLAWIFGGLAIAFFSAHAIHYLPFIMYLNRVKLDGIGKAYGVSLIRDGLSAVAALHGALSFMISGRKQQFQC